MKQLLVMVAIMLFFSSIAIHATTRDFQYEIINGGSRGTVMVMRNIPGTEDQWQAMDNFNYPQYQSYTINRSNIYIGLSTSLKATITRSDNGQSKTVIQDIVPGLNYVLLEFTYVIVPGPDPVPKSEDE